MQQQINLTENVKIEFTPQQLPIVLKWLRKGIFEEVLPIIDSIEKQVIHHVNKKTEQKSNGDLEPTI